MSLRRLGCMLLLLGLLGLLGHSSTARAQKTYYIGETTNFNQTGVPTACQNSNLNDVTSSLQTLLDDDGWSGVRFTDAGTFPTDIEDPNVQANGADGTWGDARDLVIYAGHGNNNLLQYGSPDPFTGQCIVRPNTQVRLGTQAGDSAEYAAYITSCTMERDQLSTLWNNQTREQFGFDDSPSIGDNKPKKWYRDTDTDDNATQWMKKMKHKAGTWFGENEPTTMATSPVSASNCQWMLNNDQLRNDPGFWPIAEPWTHWCIEFYDNDDEC